MGSVYRFAFFSFLSFIFAVNLASTYKELTMEDFSQAHRRSIMNMVAEMLGGILEPEQEQKFDELDKYVCSVLEIDINNFPDHTI